MYRENSNNAIRGLITFGRVATLALTFLSIFGVRTTYAWGDTGHRIICAIAFQELNLRARAEVQRLIRLDPDFTQFSVSCTWPDHPRKRSREHYVNLPREAKRLEAALCPLESPCILTAIRQEVSILADATTSDERKLEALKFLGHWVGDIHQPLHVSFHDDRGGNAIKANGLCSGNLHEVWDTCLIEKQFELNVMALAAALRSSVQDDSRALWTHTEPMDWANESFAITVASTVEYCIQKDDACWYAYDHETLDVDEDNRVVVVDDTYITKHLPTIKQRLTQAGIRLGSLLNHTLGAP